MIKITYTLDSVENEPGPNLYWRGSPTDYLRLLNDLHSLGVDSGRRVDLIQLDYIYIVEGYRMVLESSNAGTTLLAVSDDVLNMSLDYQIWRKLLHYVLSISYGESFAYLELDDLDLHEDANIIISSNSEA